MVGRRIAGAVLLLLALAPVASSAGQGEYTPGMGIGAGILSAWTASPLHSFDGASGTGLQVTLETHLSERWVWNLRVGGFYPKLKAPEEIYYPADAGDWSIGATALRFDLASTGEATWWAGPEGSLHYAQMKHFAYVGSGFGLGPVFGVDLPQRDGRFVVQLGSRLAWIWLTTDSATAASPTFMVSLGLDLLYRFRRGDSP